jgi:hypothetical protein
MRWFGGGPEPTITTRGPRTQVCRPPYHRLTHAKSRLYVIRVRPPAQHLEPALHRVGRVARQRIEADLGVSGMSMHDVDELLEKD